ncbi:MULTISPECIES: hypothetical protein [Arcobacteraceae]|uniref:hypothetical protein n=1 Tax=Arcobacteraceae TaxID=2808963 RepID=UPI000DE92B91|nr:hypothetical protein [Arcobacter sp. CECT 9188]RBQ27787.1 hypothetical protein CRU88_03710 [Arcobacter sp. CECT 9188]
MKKITILALGGAGANFLNSFEKEFKKDSLGIAFNLLHLEEKSFNKSNLEKSLKGSSKVFVLFGIGSNSKLSMVLSDILNKEAYLSNYIIIKPFAFEDDEKLKLFEDINEKLNNMVKNIQIIDCDEISSNNLDENISISKIFLNIDKYIFEQILEKTS